MRQSFSLGQQLTSAQMTQLQSSVWTDDNNTLSGSSYTLSLTDAGKQMIMTGNTTPVLNIPPNSGVPLPVGTCIKVIYTGTSYLQISTGAGVGFADSSTGLSLAKRVILEKYEMVNITKIGTDTWLIMKTARFSEDTQNIISSQVFS